MGWLGRLGRPKTPGYKLLAKVVVQININMTVKREQKSNNADIIQDLLTKDSEENVDVGCSERELLVQNVTAGTIEENFQEERRTKSTPTEVNEQKNDNVTVYSALRQHETVKTSKRTKQELIC
jgi:hypothetical protein